MWRFLLDIPEGYELVEKKEFKEKRLREELEALKKATTRYEIRISEIEKELKETE